jgi:hypothetical protein
MNGSVRDSLAGNAVLYRCAIAVLCAAVLSGLVEPLMAITRWVPLDPNEGWNAFFAQIAMRGGHLYPPPGSFIVNNYPPVSFYLVGAIGHIIGDNIFAGRIVALLSMVIVVVNVYFWARAAGSAARIALLAAALTAAYAVTYARGYAAINDPQWLAHALMTTGMVVMWRGNSSTRAIVLGAFIMLLGGWTKHLLVPVPIATTWWLVRRSRSAWVTWLSWSTFGLVLSGFLVWAKFGGAFFESLHAARQYSVRQAITETGRALKCFVPIMIPSLALLCFTRRNERAEFAVAYLVSAAAVAVAASGGVGVDMNAFFDLMIAGSLCAAFAIEAVWERPLPGRFAGYDWGPVLTLLISASLGAYAASLVPGIVRDIEGLDALETQTLAATRLLATRAHGRAACESPELCYWAENEFNFDFFNYGQRLKVGKQPLTPCEAVLDGRFISMVQLDRYKHGEGTPQLPASCNALIRSNYRLVMRASFGDVFESKDAVESKAAVESKDASESGTDLR